MGGWREKRIYHFEVHLIFFFGCLYFTQFTQKNCVFFAIGNQKIIIPLYICSFWCLYHPFFQNVFFCASVDSFHYKELNMCFAY